MGRSEKERKESKEEKLLRKAKEYIEKHKDQPRKHHKKDKKRKKEDKKKDKRKRSRKESKVYLGEIVGKPPAKTLGKDDYFAFHQHLWVYLYRQEGLSFNDLDSDETHEAFRRFCKAYNKGKLESAYYDELPAAALEECKTTRHSWKFRTSATEERSLSHLQEGIRKQTEFKVSGGSESVVAEQKSVPPNQGDEGEQGRQRKSAEDRYHDRVINQRLKSHSKNVVEELQGGPKDFKERQREKRKEASERMHAASRDKDGAGVELTDAGIYGSDRGDFKAALAREQSRKNKRNQAKESRVRELQAKESQKQQDMLEMLGIANVPAGQKIKIAPRKGG